MPKRKPRNPQTQPGVMLTVDQVWELIGKDNITRQALYLAVARGEIPSIRLGRRILIPRHAVEQLLTLKQSVPPAA